ncbi:MAG: hypothetical protein HY677_03795 [Chloroflexi bacterium]|nr:hypothetical protein [Chloroflexota bacterium]
MLSQDEFLHSSQLARMGRPLPGAHRFFNDRLSLTVLDREANIFGINHIQVSTNRGFARFRSVFSVDGDSVSYANRSTIDGQQLTFEKLSDGHMSYQVVEPLKKVRVTFDGPQYAFDLTYEGRAAAFDFDDCLEGHPLGGAQTTGGHYEQAVTCRGEFEVRRGPRKGERRAVNCLANRNHTWDFRYGDKAVWDMAPGEHRWPTIYLPERHFGFYIGQGRGAEYGRLHEGGYLGTPVRNRSLRRINLNVDMAEGRVARAFQCVLTLPNREVFRIHTTRSYGQLQLPMYGEDDKEVCLDCHYDFFDVELEDMGENGTAVYEHSYFA